MKESPLNKALVGDQDQLPEQLKEKILSMIKKLTHLF